MPSPNLMALKAYLTPEEYSKVALQAEKCGLTLSSYVKRLVLGRDVRSKLDHDLIMDLMKASADLGRLGGLLKLGIVEGSLRPAMTGKVLKSIMSAKDVLEDKILAL